MKVMSSDEALELWKSNGLWDWFQSQSLPIFFALPQDSSRRVFYGQKDQTDPRWNFVTVIDCESDEELEDVKRELKRRVPDGNNADMRPGINGVDFN